MAVPAWIPALVDDGTTSVDLDGVLVGHQRGRCQMGAEIRPSNLGDMASVLVGRGPLVSQ